MTHKTLQSFPNHFFRSLLGVLLIFCTTTSCTRSSLPTPVETEASAATTRWLDSQYSIYETPALSSMIRRISNRLSEAAYGTALQTEIQNFNAEEYRDFPWQVYVLDSTALNAFSSGAGTIFITRGLVAKLHAEAELASIISHEMAHQMLGHNRQALTEAGTSNDSPHFAFSLDRELEADDLGLKILKVARYDLSAALSALSLSYRPEEAVVAGDPEVWANRRMANLHERLAEMGDYLPATMNTREFVRVRNGIAG